MSDKIESFVDIEKIKSETDAVIAEFKRLEEAIENLKSVWQSLFTGLDKIK